MDGRSWHGCVADSCAFARTPRCRIFVPQEEGNIPYVLDNEVGAFETRPDRIADILSRWLLEGGQEARAAFEAMAKRAKALGRPEVRAGG